MFFYQRVLFRLMRLYLELKNIIFGRVFACRALEGRSDYSLTISADLNVSCNCRDYDGSGKIGNLESSSLSGILGGQRARQFRDSLSRGRLPLLTCCRCSELISIRKEKLATDYGKPLNCIKGLMVENTSRCNLKCLSCNRKLIKKNRSSVCMSLENMSKVSSVIKDYKVERLNFFNLGEPFLCNNVDEQLSILRKDNPNLYIITSTNGLFLDTDKKREAALKCNEIMFSIDGSTQESVIKYQRGNNFEKVYTNMKELVDYRNSFNRKIPLIEWKYVLFNWNDSKELIFRAVELARVARVDILSFWPTISPLYGISLRYYFAGYFRNLGKKSWKGREVIFNWS